MTGKRIIGTPFPKGNSANPSGRPKEKPEIRKFKEMTYQDFIDRLQQFGSYTAPQLDALLKSKDTPVFHLIFGKVLAEAKNGNMKAIGILFERLWGKPKETDLPPAGDINLRPLQNATPEQLKNILDGAVLTLPTAQVKDD